MCGIAGIFNADAASASTDWQCVNRIIIDQHARGPDNHSIMVIRNDPITTILGHNRLSIIDLSESANQPLWDAEQEFCIIYNGQIYNYQEIKSELVQKQHRFITHSDTEVVLRAFREWREHCIDHLNGMFAFAIYEKATKNIWLFRDRFGVKPLFYIISNNKLYFASSTNILAKHFGLSPNLDYVARGLRHWVYESDGSETPYQGLFSLPAGHFLWANIIDSKLVTQIQRYYSLEKRIAQTEINLSMDAVIDQLKNAVNIRLRADVPIGFALSSGLDSSTLAVLASLNDISMNAFCFGSPQLKKTEGPLVAKLSKRFNIKTHYVMPTPKEFAEAFKATLLAQDAPFVSCSVIAQYLVYRAAQQQGLKVLLSGQGADEAFLGYRKFQFYYLKQLLRQKRFRTMTPQLIGMLISFFHELGLLKTIFPKITRHLRKGGIGTELILPTHTNGVSDKKTLIQRSLDDVTRLSIPTLLRYEDRNSMANSIESRLPFMDYRVIELALSLPDDMKIKFGYGKWVVRQAMKSLLPNEIRLARSKRGFDARDAFWIKQGLGDVMRSMLHASYSNVKMFLPKNTKVDDLYSDAALISRHNAFGEATSLIWLGMKI